MIRVQVIADSSVERAGLEALLREEERFELVTHTGPAAGAALLSVRSYETDVVVAVLSDKDRFSSLAIAPSEGVPAAVVLLSDDLNRADVMRMLGRPVRAVLRRDALPQEIVAAVEAAAAGLITMGQEEWELLAPAENFVAPWRGAALEELTPREAEVLALMAQGLGNKNIAEQLHVSEHTIKFHVSSILAKLGASSRTEAVTIGLRDGLLIL